MTPRDTPRPAPDTPRHFAVELPEPHGLYHFRFPSYGKALRLLGLLQQLRNVSEGNTTEGLADLLDAAGYAIGVCWWNRAYDLEAGSPPGRRDTGDAWRDYGDAVVDELQERGITFQHLMVIVPELIAQLSARMTDIQEAQVEAGNSRPPAGSVQAGGTIDESGTTPANP